MNQLRGHAACTEPRSNTAPGCDAATVKHALTGQKPPSKRNHSQRNPILDDYRCHIDDMIAVDPAVTVSAIWERLVDHYCVQVSYATVRDYIARERRQPAPAPDPTPPRTEANRDPEQLH